MFFFVIADLLKQSEDGWTGLYTAVVNEDITQVQSILKDATQVNVLQELIDKVEQHHPQPNQR